jgi:FkbM family methyltransferase
MNLLTLLRRAKRFALGGKADVPSRSEQGSATVVPPLDPIELLGRVLGSDNPLVAVDIGGANDLQPHWWRLVGVAKFIVYEPHGGSYRELLERQTANPIYRDFRYINEALSESGGQRILYQTNVPTGSSLIPPKKGGMGDHSRSTYFWPLTEKLIQTSTLADSLDRETIGFVDMIKLDTQGTELEILRGLDRQRLSRTLLVEAECSILDVYEGGERALEDMLRFMREHDLVLFDLRTNRFLGNSVRLDPDELKRTLGSDMELPPIAHRLAEVDAVFARDPKSLIASGADASLLRRFVAILITYNFFPEAVFTVIAGRDGGTFGDADAEELLRLIGDLKTLAGNGLGTVGDQVRAAGGLTWAQYMWVPYPSA